MAERQRTRRAPTADVVVLALELFISSTNLAVSVAAPPAAKRTLFRREGSHQGEEIRPIPSDRPTDFALAAAILSLTVWQSRLAVIVLLLPSKETVATIGLIYDSLLALLWVYGVATQVSSYHERGYPGADSGSTGYCSLEGALLLSSVSAMIFYLARVAMWPLHAGCIRQRECFTEKAPFAEGPDDDVVEGEEHPGQERIQEDGSARGTGLMISPHPLFETSDTL